MFAPTSSFWGLEVECNCQEGHKSILIRRLFQKQSVIWHDSWCWERRVSVNFSLLGIPRPHIQQDESSWRVIQFPSLPAFGLHAFFPSLSVEPFYGSPEKCRHQRTTLLGYYELMWSKTGKDGGRETLVMDRKLHFLWNDGIRSGC